ncbi:Abi family protein [Vibrio vulnificus]|uniref:Abi family protein n=1 Tax=Vibrio vulnificus TaxID=672 RepID=UPI0015FAE03F|nr:Abi family protein [Vibrio vulnificus]EJO9866795.1 Abi family protein [Vibrio vulnificus]MBN8146084.1 Abi family protein [Vibrio vulnificus]QMV39579.1 Abi family protein [Vibrio vulnificus]HAS6109556.1 Abi family protein [Vibrio vulnificus]HAS6161634.1 Abi family protein [Vibrio vulnificus]
MELLDPPKEYKSYDELLNLLKQRGMSIECDDRAKRKLAQVGYYRLSGFSYSCRQLQKKEDGQLELCNVMRTPKRENYFIAGTSFNSVFNLYLFDKRLRVLMMDALERIEVHTRALVAHEIGKGHKKEPGTGKLVPDPMAWQDPTYINPKHLLTKQGRKSDWDKWIENHEKLIQRSREDCIEWHKRTKKSMPFWVVIEAWDFGTLSKYFGMLNDTYKKRVCQRLGLTDPKAPKVLTSWLMSMNLLRNRCAHHSRIWNQKANSALLLPDNSEYFDKINLDDNSRTRLFGLIVTMNYLLQQIGKSSIWMHQVMSEIQKFPSLPGCQLKSLGIPDSGIPNHEDLGLNKLTLVQATIDTDSTSLE